MCREMCSRDSMNERSPYGFMTGRAINRSEVIGTDRTCLSQETATSRAITTLAALLRDRSRLCPNNRCLDHRSRVPVRVLLTDALYGAPVHHTSPTRANPRTRLVCELAGDMVFRGGPDNNARRLMQGVTPLP